MLVSNLLISNKAATARPAAEYEPTSTEMLTVEGENEQTHANFAPNARAVVAAFGNVAPHNASNYVVHRFNLCNAAGERIRAVELRSFLHVGTDGAEAGHLEIWETIGGAVTKVCEVYPDHLILPTAASDPTVGIRDGSLYYNTATDKIKIRANSAWETVTSA